jgi:hypothetical protein
MNRRKFFAFLPVAPLALVAEGARAVTADGAPIPEATKIVLQGNKKVEHKPSILASIHNTSGNQLTLGSWSMGTADTSKNLSMAVGDDGDLWLKRTDGEWRKVVTE